MKWFGWLWRRVSDFGNADLIVGLLGGWRMVTSGIIAFFTGGAAFGDGLPLWLAILVGLIALLVALLVLALLVKILDHLRQSNVTKNKDDGFISMAEAGRYAYEAMREAKGRLLDATEHKATQPGHSTLSVCADYLVLSRGLAIYGTRPPSTRRELVSPEDHFDTEFSEDANRFIGGDGMGKWTNLVVKKSELTPHLMAIQSGEAASPKTVGPVSANPTEEALASVQFRLEPAGPNDDFRVTAVIKGNRYEKDVAVLGRVAHCIHYGDGSAAWKWSPSSRLESKDSIYPSECWELPILQRPRRGPNLVAVFGEEIRLKEDTLMQIEVKLANTHSAATARAIYWLQEIKGVLLFQLTHPSHVAFITDPQQ